jgi:hypothetical protein
LTTTLILAFALFLFRPATAALTAELTPDLVLALAADLAADLVADFVADLVAGLAPGFVVDLTPALPLSPPLSAFATPDSAATPDLVSGQRALRRWAALRAVAVRGRRRSGAVPGPPPLVWLRTSPMAAVTSSIDAMPSTVLSTPLPA